jgi:DHA1 family bicyclomycin/chloramphenicol resistance-like MFS transporter
MNTQTKIELPLLTLLLMLSFASVNAVLFTPALPDIAEFFNISADAAQQTIALFLVGYALGQLVYGPIANRFGRKHALYSGVIIQILSSLLCVFSGLIESFNLLLLGRFLLALGSGVGLNMTITLVSECYDPRTAGEKISYLLLAFAVTPGLGIALGGILNTQFGWMSCFYAGGIYGLLLLFLISRLPETLKTPNLNALKLRHLLHSYYFQFKNIRLVSSGLLIGATTSFIYIFAATAPFISIKLHGMSSEQYGFSNLLPPLGFLIGSLCSAQMAKRYQSEFIIRIGITITSIGTIVMGIAIFFNIPILFALFLPMVLMYFGNSLVPANVSALTLPSITDKANASAVLSFVNMGLATVVALNVGFLPITIWILPSLFFILCCFMMLIYHLGITQKFD